jgi:LPXTG-motif cell wall-anchored protein
MTVAVCLAFGLLVAPGVALADPWAPHAPSDVPWVWDGHGKGDVCKQRGEPPCHSTTTTPPVTTSTGATTTTTDVSGTSATSATTTGTATSTTSVTTTTDVGSTTTTGVGSTTATSHTVPPKATVPAGPPLGGSTATNALADTGATPLWTGLGGLAVLLAGAVLVLFSRRRRA